MKTLSIAVLAVSMLAGAAFSHEGHEGSAKGADKTMTGEVVDLACYAGHEAKGEKHASCAKKCLEGGSPAGLLTSDGKVFVLVNSHEAEAAYKKLAGLGGEKAKISGHPSSKGGLQAFIVENVEPAK